MEIREILGNSPQLLSNLVCHISFPCEGNMSPYCSPTDPSDCNIMIVVIIMYLTIKFPHYSHVALFQFFSSSIWYLSCYPHSPTEQSCTSNEWLEMLVIYHWRWNYGLLLVKWTKNGCINPYIKLGIRRRPHGCVSDFFSKHSVNDLVKHSNKSLSLQDFRILKM